MAAILAGGGGKVYGDFTFGNPQNLGPVINSPSADAGTCFSADSLELYFASNRPGGFGSYDLWVSTRQSMNDPWGPPINLGPAVNSPYTEICPSISSDGLTLYFSDDWDVSARPGGYGGFDLWVTNRATLSDLWGPPVNLGPTVNSSNADLYPSISSDGLLLFFDCGPASLSGPDDILVTRRATVSDPWGTPVNLGPTVNSSFFDGAPSISADGSTLYFMSGRPGGYGSWDLWQVSIEPLVDFNGDEIVDINDLVKLIEYWGQSEPSVDIGPMPWGDGVVDKEDLEVLMSYWQQEVLPVTLLAYWKLDETEGSIAKDSVGELDCTLHGGPVWQPTAGKVNGTLQLDGIDDYVSTPFVLNPAAGAFSVFAWIKGGAAGQVIISQVGGLNWLLADPSGGKLMTELQGTGRGAAPTLLSQTIITDGNWHRIGFVWDGSYRTLYVDDVEVAKDAQAQTGVASTYGGLHIGAGKNLETGSFWSGLIDDVRIYDRAVTP